MNEMIKTRKSVPFIMHVLALVALCVVILPSHPYRLFEWLDGSFMRYLTIQQHQRMGYFTYGMNIFEGLGDMSFPLLINLIPASWFDLILQPGLPYSVAVYTTLSVQYFIAAYLLCCIFHFSKTIALSAAWLTTFFVLPLLPSCHGLQSFYQITAISPYVINFIFFCNLFLFCFFHVGRVILIHSILLSCATIAIILYLLIANGVGIFLAVPFFTFFCCTFILNAESKFEVLTKITFSIITLILLARLHYFQFVFGLFLYSIAAFFPSNLSTNFSPDAISILLSDTYPAGQYIAGLGIVGMLITLLSGSKELKRPALLVSIFVSILFLFGASILYLPGWYHGPNPMYFEYLLWPIYMAFACMLLAYIFCFIKWVFQKLNVGFNLQNRQYLIHINKTPYVLFLIFSAALAVNYIYLEDEYEPVFAYPQTHPPPIIQYLITHAAIPQNGVFKGYTASFYPKVESKHITDWYQQHYFDAAVLLPKRSYYYRMTGLLFFNIPTLEKYSPLSSPALFALIHSALKRPIDHEVRNIFLLTKINIPLLQALGVKYIITNEQIELPSLKLVVTKFIDEKNGSLYLYNILHSNIANFSPHQFLPLNNINAFLDKVNRQQIDFSKIAYVTSDIPYKLSPLKNAAIYLISDGIHVVASASGTSAVLLPILYSHCLNFSFNGEKPGIFTAQRANLAETLLIFKDNVDVNINYRYGLMKYADCRLEDRNDLKNIMHASS